MPQFYFRNRITKLHYTAFFKRSQAKDPLKCVRVRNLSNFNEKSAEFLINIFRSAAYNKLVEKITITQSGFDGLYMSYLYGKVKEKFSYLPAHAALQKDGDRTVLDFQTEKKYCPYVRRYAEENISDIVAVGYKYRFFKDRLRLPLLSEREQRLLFTALAAADLQDDREIVSRAFKGFEAYCLDGVYHFRLRDLKKRWEEIADYISSDFGPQSLDGFIGFLVSDGTGKTYIKDGKAYDERYRVLTKSALTGERSLIGEILLCGAEQVYCFGDVDGATKDFLLKFYKEKAVFC